MIFISFLLGLLIGVEREWSNRQSGIRTFSIVSLTGTASVLSGQVYISSIGAVMVIFITIYMVMINYLKEDFPGIPITTSISLFLTYIIGLLIGHGLYISGITLSILTSVLLVLRNELHSIASNLSDREIKSIIKFSVFAVLVTIYVPDKTLGPYNSVDLQLIWSLVVAISSIGFFNYILFKRYKKQSFLITSFLGSLVNSTATIIEIINRLDKNKMNTDHISSLILISNISMISRNVLILVLFVPQTLFSLLFPITIMIILMLFSILYLIELNPSKLIESEEEEEIDLKTPFSIKSASIFGFLFLLILLFSSASQSLGSSLGVIGVSFFGGFASSGTVISSIITLISNDSINITIAEVSIIAGISSSIFIKVFIILAKNKREIALKVFIHSLISVSISTLILILLI